MCSGACKSQRPITIRRPPRVYPLEPAREGTLLERTVLRHEDELVELRRRLEELEKAGVR